MQHTDHIWPMHISLIKKVKQLGRWHSVHWELDQILPSSSDAPLGSHLVLLELHKDERASYRLNLDLDNPVLYLICDELADGTWVPTAISADQHLAAGCLEGDTPVISFAMPEAIACWIEAYITRHGEVEISAHRRKHVDRRKELNTNER